MRIGLGVLMAAGGLICLAPLAGTAAQPPQIPDEEVEELVRKQLDEWQQGRRAFDQLRQQELEAEIEAAARQSIARLHKTLSKYEADEQRKQALHQLFSALLFLVLAAASGVYLVLKFLRKPKQRPC